MRRLLLTCSLLVAVFACGGGNEEPSRTALTLEQYMRRMEEIAGETDRRVAEEVFRSDSTTAQEGGPTFLIILDDAKVLYSEVSPPTLVETEHDEAREAIDEYGDALDEAVDTAPEGTRLRDLLAQDELVAADARLTSAFCSIEQLAARNQIQADLGCTQEPPP